jgi:hypothetical protein
MIDNCGEKYKDTFHKQASLVLSGLPDKLQAFNANWDARNYRMAYLIYHEAATESGVDKNSRDEKVDSDFYWYFVN